MTSNEYLLSIVNKYKLPEIDYITELLVIDPLKKIIEEWAGSYLREVKLSGSRAKGTAISLSSDLDLFISLSSVTPGSLKEIYESLFSYAYEKNLQPRRQNVSIGIQLQGKSVDLVPARRESQYGNDHSLYRRKADTWTKTNIDTHISQVRNSDRINEIVALKIWEQRHELEFPSIYLETFAIDALSGRSHTDHSGNFLHLLACISNNIENKRIVDPANTNNILSDELTAPEKKALREQASKSLAEKYWGNIIW